MIGLISATPAGALARDRLASSRPQHTRVYEAATTEAALSRAFAECDRLVCFLGTGTTLHLLAPLLRARTAAPSLVCVDESGRHAVPLLEGNGGGARELAAWAAGQLPGCSPSAARSRETEPTGVPVLDSLGWPLEGAVDAVARALLDGAPIAVCSTVGWPLPALPPNVTATGGAPGERGTPGLWVTDQVVPVGRTEAVLRPPTLTIGVGTCQGTAADEVVELVEQALDDAGLSVRSVAELASVDIRADEPGLNGAAHRLGLPLRTYSATELTPVAVPNPSGTAVSAVGTPSVAEAAALLATDGGGELVVPKVKSAPPDGSPPRATAAVARRRAQRDPATGASATAAVPGTASGTALPAYGHEKAEVSDVHVV